MGARHFFSGHFSLSNPFAPLQATDSASRYPHLQVPTPPGARHFSSTLFASCRVVLCKLHFLCKLTGFVRCQAPFLGTFFMVPEMQANSMSTHQRKLLMCEPMSIGRSEKPGASFLGTLFSVYGLRIASNFKPGYPLKFSSVLNEKSIRMGAWHQRGRVQNTKTGGTSKCSHPFQFSPCPRSQHQLFVESRDNCYRKKII